MLPTGKIEGSSSLMFRHHSGQWFYGEVGHCQHSSRIALVTMLVGIPFMPRSFKSWFTYLKSSGYK